MIIWGNCKNIETSDCWSRNMLNFHFWKKGSGSSFANTFCAWLFKKNISHVIFCLLIKFHCLIAFTSWDIWQCMYFICLLSSLWRRNFEIYLSSLSSRFPTLPKIQNKSWNITRMKRAFKVKSFLSLRWNCNQFSNDFWTFWVSGISMFQIKLWSYFHIDPKNLSSILNVVCIKFTSNRKTKMISLMIRG